MGDLKLFVQALEQMQKTFRSIQSKLPEDAREQFQLWLYRFQFKRYQFQAAAPSIRNIESFESVQQLTAFISRFERYLALLKKALASLRRYNLLYNKLALSQNVQAQIRLQASLSTERDLEGLVRQGQIYVALLRFARGSWDDKKAIKRKLASQETSLQELREQQRRATIDRSAIRKEQKALVSKVKEAHLLFTKEQLALVQRKNTARTLFIVGGVLTVVGLGASITGGIFLHDLNTKNPYTTYQCEAIQETGPRTACEQQRALPNPIIPPPQDDAGQRGLKQFYGWGGPTFLAAGLIVGGTGIALIIAGLVTTPPNNAGIQTVLRSQEKFLQEQSQPSSGTTQIPARNTIPPHSPRLLGVFR
ncbi:MAG: hypothetical protein H6727_16960 [Myxococcales bacterium]|nr:hypothetical protein [Myxococcales bacterium]